MGLEPTVSRTTIWRVNQLRHTHHILLSVRARTICPGGLEPPTPGLEGRCSIQLSYGHITPAEDQAVHNGLKKAIVKAGDGNRTHISSLEG